MNPTAESFEEEFGDYLLDGLSTTGTYIPLRVNKRMGINVAIRPVVKRLSPDVVLFGGTLRVGYTREDGEPINTKVVALNEETQVQQLKDFCKGWAWQKQSGARFSSIVGVGMAASKYNGDTAVDFIVTNGTAADLIKRLEKNYKKYNGVGFSSVNKASAALTAAWILQAKYVFEDMPEVEKLPDSLVGVSTGVLNSGQDKYSDNVVSFQEKVKALKTPK